MHDGHRVLDRAPTIHVIPYPVISGLAAPSPAGWMYRTAPRRSSSS